MVAVVALVAFFCTVLFFFFVGALFLLGGSVFDVETGFANVKPEAVVLATVRA